MPSLLFLVSVLASQSQQLTATELSLGTAAVIAHHTFVGAELGLARRPNGDSRVALALAGGTLDGRLAARAQLTLQLLLNSAARKGPGFYAGVGGAATARRHAPSHGFLAVLLGCEVAPGRRRGAYVELGFAGGVRAAVGWRIRRFPKWWG